MATDTSLAGQQLRMSAAQIAIAVGGSVAAGARETKVEGVSTDSRTTAKGNLFVALAGEKFDGHDFVEAAARRGAVAALVTKKNAAKLEKLGLALVAVDEKDVLLALGRLGRAHRDTLSIPIVGITGSAGKSTAKEMTAAVLGGAGKKVLKTEGNLNNRIGVPLTVMSIGKEHSAAVVEMGISFPGEMAELVKIAKPDVRVLLNAGVSHVEFLKDADGVAAEKAHIWDDARESDTMVFNADDTRVNREVGKRRSKHPNWLSFGLGPGFADVQALGNRAGALGEQTITVKLRDTMQDVKLKAFGFHHVMNLLAASAIGLALKVPAEEIARGIETRFKPMPGRGDLVRLRDDIVLIDDTYNSNPTSAAAALSALADAKKAGRSRAIAALGDMLELGDAASNEHGRIGRLAGQQKIDVLYAFGPLTTRRVAEEAERTGVAAVKRFDSRQALAEELAADLKPGDVLLVKGSRGMKMDEVVKAITHARGVA